MAKACAILGVIIGLLYSNEISATIKNFGNGSGDHQWHNALNWSPIGVPIFGDTVQVTSDSVVVNTTQLAKKLSLSHSTLFIEPGGQLIISTIAVGIVAENSQITNEGAIDISYTEEVALQLIQSDFVNKAYASFLITEFEAVAIDIDDQSRFKNSNDGLVEITAASDPSGSPAIQNRNILDNLGVLKIHLAHQGILNEDTLINRGMLQIDSVILYGLQNTLGGTIDNSDTISSTSARIHILNEDGCSISNKIDGFIGLSDKLGVEERTGIFNQGDLVNRGKIEMKKLQKGYSQSSASGAGTISTSLYNYGTLRVAESITAFSVIGLSEAYNHGLLQCSKSQATSTPFLNRSIFTNEVSGEIRIEDDLSLSSANQPAVVNIRDDFVPIGAFNNYGLMHIADQHRTGIRNEGEWYNHDTIALFMIDGDGLVNQPNDGIFFNEEMGVLTVDSVTGSAIINESNIEDRVTFQNKGRIRCSKVGEDAILQIGNADFQNDSSITILSTQGYAINQSGLQAEFTNASVGEIILNKTNDSSAKGIHNESNFRNQGTIRILNIKSFAVVNQGSDAIWNNSGDLFIEDCESGFWNLQEAELLLPLDALIEIVQINDIGLQLESISTIDGVLLIDP